MTNRIEEVASAAAKKAVAFSACARHCFDMSATDASDLLNHGRRVTCIVCHGHAPMLYALSYIKGYVAAGLPVGDVALNLRVPLEANPQCTCPQCDGKNRMPYPGAWARGSDCPLCQSAGVVYREQEITFLLSSRKRC